LAVGIYDCISTTKTHNRVLEVNLYKRVVCMIEVQMLLYKTDVIPPWLCCYTEVVYVTYTMAT